MEEPKIKEALKFKDFYVHSERLFSIVTLNPFHQYVNPSVGILKVVVMVIYWLIYASLVAFLGLQLVYLIHLIKYDENATVMGYISSAAWLVTGLMAMECMLFIWLKGERLTRLLGRIEHSFPSTKEMQDYGKYEHYYGIWMTISASAVNIYFFALYSIFIQPVGISIYEYSKTGSWYLILPGLLWYPFDRENNFYRIFAYAFECWGFMVLTRPMVSVGLFLGSTTMHLCCQFKSLAREFQDLRPTKGNFVGDCRKLRDLVQKHNYLIDVAGELEDTYRVSLVVNYVVSSVVIAFFGFLVMNEGDMNKKMEYIFDFSCFLCYNSLFSFYGNSLMDRSEDISTALYESDWFDADLRYKKNMLMVMARSSKPCQLDGFFFVVCYQSYTKILASSYSYLALLRASSQKQN